MEHNHNHIPKLEHLNRAFMIGIFINLAFVILQIGVGLKINSLSLLSDAGHNFLDVGGLALALLAFKLAKSRANENYTYGYKKLSIFISLINAIVLLISIGAIGYEAFFRLQNPEPLPGKTIAFIAFIGVIINGFSAFLFFKDKENDINIKSAFLHLFSDALLSLGLVIGGIIIYYTEMYWVDSALSIIICLVILVSTWNLLKDSIILSLDGLPRNIDFEKVKETFQKIEGVLSFHHLHIWAISTSENALSGHIVVEERLTTDELYAIRRDLKHELEHLNIEHCTIEIETEKYKCEEVNC
jgi:cobalt-zinc-cadmium efflux system protein